VVLEPVAVEHIKTVVERGTVVVVETVVAVNITLFEFTLSEVMFIEKWDSDL
jgi:hypothetical protein